MPAGRDQIIVSGTPGLDENGAIPADFAEEARQAWRNVAAILDQAGASISDIVSVRQYLTRPQDIKTYVDVRKEMIEHEPAFMLSVVSALVWPRSTSRSRSWPSPRRQAAERAERPADRHKMSQRTRNG